MQLGSVGPVTSRRVFFLSGGLLLSGLAPARGALATGSNTEVLRALERRKQSLEPQRRGTRSLEELSDKVVALEEAIDSAILAAKQNDSGALLSLLPQLKDDLEQSSSLAAELTVLLRCVRPTFDRFEGLKWTGASEKLLSTLNRPELVDPSVLMSDLMRTKTALSEIRLELSTTLGDPTKLWSFCYELD